MNGSVSAATEQFRARAPMIAAIGGLLFLGFLALAWFRGRSLDWIVFGPLAAASGLLAIAAASGFVYRIGPDTVDVRALGLSLTRIPVKELTAVEVEQVSPVGQYGGWGVRGSRANRAYLLGNGRGVRMRLAGRQVFLGYENAEALRDSIRRQSRAGS